MAKFGLMLAGALAAAVLAPAPASAAVQQQECPSLVVLAARGSEQNEVLRPTSYSPESPWVSNGYEEKNIRAFLHFAEARHRAETGESLLADVHVLALDDTVYPASLPLPALAEPGEELDALQTAGRLGEVLRETPAHVIAHEAATGFAGSLHSGINGTMGYVDAWEAETGCRPGYVLVGYSQGAVVLLAQEAELTRRGQLVGSLYFGNPLHAVMQGRGSESNGVSHCAPGDYVCDLTSSAAQSALANGGGVHNGYFLDVDQGPAGSDAHVADRFREWVSGYTSRP